MTEFEMYCACEASEWLKHCRSLRFDVIRATDDLDIARSMAEPAGIDYSRVTVATSATPDGLERAAEKIAEASDRLEASIAAYVGEIDDARKRICSIPDKRYATLLDLYYLNARTWEEVAERMSYSKDWLQHMRSEALLAAWLVMPREWKTRIPRADG